MAGRPLDVLLDGGSFFEGPRWHEGRWWVSDFYRHAVIAVEPGGATETVMTVDGQPSGLGWLPDGSLLVVSMKDHLILRRSTGGDVVVHADLRELDGLGPTPINDMVVSASGHAYVGSFGFEIMKGAKLATAVLVRVAPDGSATVAADGLLFPNGSVITPEGDRLIVGETFGSRYTAFSIQADGTLSDRRVWAPLAPTPAPGPVGRMLTQLTIAPDGCALDAEGQIWVADALGGPVLRVAEGGAVTDEIVPPDGLAVYACMLGGADGRTLLLCAAPDFVEQARREAHEAVLLTTTVDVPHAGLP